MDWFLYDKDLRNERVKPNSHNVVDLTLKWLKWLGTINNVTLSLALLSLLQSQVRTLKDIRAFLKCFSIWIEKVYSQGKQGYFELRNNSLVIY